jgi:hypothetical protein
MYPVSRRTLATMTLFAALLPAPARGQAWTPERGEGAAAITYSNVFVDKHLINGTPTDLGQISTHVITFDVTYGLTDRMAVSLGVPLVTSRYDGTRPHPTYLDNGTYHTTVSDFQFDVRYKLIEGPVVITPFAGTVVPSHSYEFWAHSAPGRRLRQVQMGLYAASVLDRVIPRLFISGRYSHGFLQQVRDINRRTSQGSIELGYFITPELRVFGMTSGSYTHGGVDLRGIGQIHPTLLPVHDQVDKLHNLSVTAGAAVSLTDDMDLFGSFTRQIAGRNGHYLDRGLSVGVSWSFRRGRARGAAETEDEVAEGPERTLLRCVCQKSM